MFAYVRFQDNDVKTVVPVGEVRGFGPEHLRDFDNTLWYDVFWEDEHQSGYVQAQIVRLYGK